MPYTPTQQTFLGCSITGFNCSFEWAGGGTLSVGLVEDPKNFDELIEPQMGYPARFQYDSYIFDGIINDFSIKRGTGGNRVLEVVLNNPAQILDGIQIILAGYTGTVGTLYNLYNVYGYLESFGFGNSLANDAGMPWVTLVNALRTLVDTYPIRFNGVPYYLDLGELPNTLPTYYRVSGSNMSLSELVQELCEAAGYDYFWDLYGNTIKLRTVNRQLPASFGAIQSFIDANTNGQAISSDIGYQVEYNLTGRFISGGQVEKIQYVNNNLQNARAMQYGERDDYIAAFPYAAILPYFGLTSDGSVVMPKSLNYAFEGTDNSFRPTNFPDLWYVNSNSILGGGLAFPAGYPLTITEMRYALMGQKEWENFINIQSVTFSSLILHQNSNPYYGINDMLELDAEVSKKVKDLLDNMTDAKLAKLKPLDIINLDKFEKVMSVKGQRVYEFVRNLATEYFGRKFMVTLPSLYVRYDSDTGIPSSSYEISDSGYIEESLFATGASQGYIPYDYTFVSNEQNKIQAYVKFSGFQSAELDLSNYSSNDYTVVGNNVFIKCDVEPQFVFLNRATATSPRAVITLPAPVYSTEYGIDMSSSIIMALQQEWVSRGADPALTNTYLQEFVKKIGFDVLREPIPPIPLIPAMAAIPVKSNTETYGPWFYTGSNGKIEYEQNNDLVPWNFGGYTQMNLFGASMVSQAISSRFVSEAGSIDVPGAPLARTGEVLITGGPFVTGLSVTADANGGVTTSYRFNSWNVKPGKVQRYVTERYQKILELSRQQKRNIRELFRPKSEILTSQVRLAVPTFTRRVKSNTSHDVIMGENRTFDGLVDTTISIMPYYNAMNATQDSDSYLVKGAYTLDGLFRPFTTDTSVTTGIGHFEAPNASSSPTSTELNPLKAGHDIGVVLKGNSRPNSLSNDGTAGGRGIALKGPLVITGWGYDTNGKPVPNENPSTPTTSFLDSYLTKADMWKTGPVDLRWDNDRKVWAAGDTVDVQEFVFYGASTDDYIGNDGITVKGSGLAYKVNETPSQTQYITDDATRNFLIRGDNVMCIKSNGVYKIIGENGLQRSAEATSDINYDSAGPCKLKELTSLNIQAYFDHMSETGDTIDQFSDVEISYRPSENKWRYVGASCSNG